MKLVRVQSIVRGFLQRRQYRVQRLHNHGTSKYFKPEMFQNMALEVMKNNVEELSRFELERRRDMNTSGEASGSIWESIYGDVPILRL